MPAIAALVPIYIVLTGGILAPDPVVLATPLWALKCVPAAWLAATRFLVVPIALPIMFDCVIPAAVVKSLNVLPFLNMMLLLDKSVSTETIAPEFDGEKSNLQSANSVYAALLKPGIFAAGILSTSAERVAVEPAVAM